MGRFERPSAYGGCALEPVIGVLIFCVNRMTATGRAPVLVGGSLRDILCTNLSTQGVERRALLGHVVVAVIVPSLHAGQAMGLKVTSDFSTDAMRGK